MKKASKEALKAMEKWCKIGLLNESDYSKPTDLFMMLYNQTSGDTEKKATEILRSVGYKPNICEIIAMEFQIKSFQIKKTIK